MTDAENWLAAGMPPVVTEIEDPACNIPCMKGKVDSRLQRNGNPCRARTPSNDPRTQPVKLQAHTLHDA